jgi:sugar/nucleoside kinase (ribokinase family)
MDVIVISALNIDQVVWGDDDPMFRDNMTRLFPHIRWGSEVSSNADVFPRLLEFLRNRMGQPRLGGSAFNALRVIRTIAPHLRLGVIGAIGNTLSAAGFYHWFKENDVDTAFLLACVDAMPGYCLAIEVAGERTMITTRGANDRICEILRGRVQVVADRVSQARTVHLSSFLDPESPNLLADMLSRSRNRNPELEISIDPGALWAARYRDNPSLRKLFDTATLLFLNQEEFDLLYGPGSASPTECAARIGAGAGPGHARVLLKQPDRLALFDAAGVLLHERVHTRLRPDQILSSTGAGDVLAGAFLAARLRSGVSEQSCMVAAQAVVDRMLRSEWTVADDFRDIFERVLGASPGDC